MRFSLKPNPLCSLEPKAKRNNTHTHTHTIKHSTLIKNIDELIMVVMIEKSNFTGKKDDEEITHVRFESTHYHFN